MSFSHIMLSAGTTHFKAMREFYVSSMAIFGYAQIVDKESFLGLKQATGGTSFWLRDGGVDFELPVGATAEEKYKGKTHFALGAESREQVDKWYEAAIKAGGTDNGAPGLRPFGPGYYAAFVLDPLGNNIEAAHITPA